MKDGYMEIILQEDSTNMMDLLTTFFTEKGANDNVTIILANASITLILLLACIVVYMVLKHIVLRVLAKIIKLNKFQWDDFLLKRKVIHRGILIVPGVLIYGIAPIYENGEMIKVIQRLSQTYVLFVLVFVISSLLDAVDDIYRTRPISNVRPIKGFLQVIKIVAYILIGIVIVATLLDQSPLVLLGGIGAATAVFSFVFKDSILGFIAGIQLTSNDMLRIGDWIEMSKYGADGDVIDITLNTVMVQNFDKTIVTIPAYSMMADSFKNWRGMKEFGGRRIKRSIYIDVNSVMFCTDEMISRFKKVQYLHDYVIKKERELEEYNKKNAIDTSQCIYGRRMTNIGTFRAYLLNYLKNNPGINQDKIVMVRQLAPQESGIPIEIYAFTSDTAWISYEGVQSDIFDHVLAVAREFDLRIFQAPSGYDVANIKN